MREFTRSALRSNSAKSRKNGRGLSSALPNCTQDSVDPGRVSLAIFHEPVADLLVGGGGRIQDRTDFCDLFTGLVKIDSGAHACLLRGPR